MPVAPIHQLALLFHSLGTGYRQSIFFYATLAYLSTPPTHTTFIIMRASLAIPFFCLAASITPSFAVSMKYICHFCGATDVDSIFRPDRIPSVVARTNGDAAGVLAGAAVQGAGKVAQPLTDAAISNLIAAASATGIGVLSHAFIPLKEHT
jgi:hypothetical protein